MMLAKMSGCEGTVPVRRLELPLCLGRESGIAQCGEKENAKRQQSIS
jgi:hypothetical protein